MSKQIKFGSELKIGDAIEIWFGPKVDRIVALTPYTGPLAHLFPKGASIAAFQVSRLGMTIDHGAQFNVVEI